MWTVPVLGSSVSAVFDSAGQRTGCVAVLGHGAGGNLDDRGMLRVTRALAGTGLGVVRFNFLYSEHGSGRPDPMPRLQECTRAVVDHVRSELAPKRLVIGGRSLGGRAASMLAAEGFDADGLLLLAYPLHPPGQTEKLRDAHLPSIRMPVLCCNGTRDDYCEPGLMKHVLEKGPPRWTMHWIAGADHGFHVLKSSGRTDDDVMQEIATTTGLWLGNELGQGSGD